MVKTLGDIYLSFVCAKSASFNDIKIIQKDDKDDDKDYKMDAKKFFEYCKQAL